MSEHMFIGLDVHARSIAAGVLAPRPTALSRARPPRLPRAKSCVLGLL
jgi:hypothetical protein